MGVLAPIILGSCAHLCNDGIMIAVEMVGRLSQRGGKEKLAMSEQENTGLVHQAYGYFLRGDIPAVLDLLSEDVEWASPEVEGVPIASNWHGREQVGQFFQALGDAQEARQFEPREFVAQGDKVVALGHYVWHVKSTGRQWESDFAHVFVMRDGKITRFQEYADTSALADAFREGAHEGYPNKPPSW